MQRCEIRWNVLQSERRAVSRHGERDTTLHGTLWILELTYTTLGYATLAHLLYNLSGWASARQNAVAERGYDGSFSATRVINQAGSVVLEVPVADINAL